MRSRAMRKWKSTCAPTTTRRCCEIEAKILKAVKDAVAEENARWASDKISVEIKLVGDRPAGIQPLETPTVQAAFSQPPARSDETACRRREQHGLESADQPRVYRP